MSFRAVRDRPGVQAERTQLAWERTTIGIFAAAGFLLVRHLEPMTGPRLVVFSLDVVLGLLGLYLSRRRGRRTRVLDPVGDTRSVIPDARWEISCLGSAVVLIAVGSALLIIFDG